VYLERLDVRNVRNVRAARLDLSPGLVALCGANGSGKTSVLEAVYLLSTARSFRSNRAGSVITYGERAASVFGHVRDDPTGEAPGGRVALGVTKSVQGDTRLRVNGIWERNASALASALPVQLINPESLEIVVGGPAIRRRFVDWAVFHVEPRFHPAWHEYRRCLRQRNALLRSGSSDDGLFAVWETALAEAADTVDACRRGFVQRLATTLPGWLSRLTDLPAPMMRWQAGWRGERPLQEVLREQRAADQEHGHTRSGPHRGDLFLGYDGRPAKDRLSRGEQKLLACALLIAQGADLLEQAGRRCVYLVDDVAAELDADHRRRMGLTLQSLKAQVLATAADPALIRDGFGGPSALQAFHVEHGCVRPAAAHGE